MNKFKVTAVYEVETEHEIFIDGKIDKEKVSSIAKSIAQAGDDNIDDQTALELDSLNFTYTPAPVTEDCLSTDQDIASETDTMGYDGQ